ncbi:hypothetical protein KW782_04395 [Candidatus Parcubacteria bacterium]|nr:hypothetical protein [Candidatus Parcubacteria bacterium]
MFKKKKKSPLKRTRLHTRKRRLFFFKVGAGIITILLFLAGVIWLSHRDTFMISEVKAEGNTAITVEEVEKVVKRHIEGNILYFFPKANIFLYPKEDIQKELSQKLTRIQKVQVTVKNRALVVDILERIPSHSWCSGKPSKAKKECYYVDEHGYIFSEAPVFSGNAYVAFYGLVTAKNPIGSIYLDKETFEHVGLLVEFLKSKNINPYALLANSNDVLEIHFERGGKLIFKQDQDIATLISNIELVIKDTTILTPIHLPDLEYIDMRFGNKLYYKMKGDNQLQLP